MKKGAVLGAAILIVCVGAAAGAVRFLVQHRQVTAKVVPVANVNVGSFSNLDDGMYGNITSRVEQNVSLDESYQVDKVFVKEGDHVSEGTPLFSYDMTLTELKLEIARLKQQTEELHLQRMEKELKKLGGTLTAQLIPNEIKQLAAGEEASREEQVIQPPEEAPTEPLAEASAETPAETPTEPGTKTPVETPAEPGTETPVETPAEPGTEAPAETPAEPETEEPAETPTEPETEAPAETPTEPEKEAPAETPTEPETEAPVETPTEPETETPVETPTEPETEESTETSTETETESETESETENGTETLPDEETLKNLQIYCSLAEAVLNAADASAEQTLTDSERAIELYQTWLADVRIPEKPEEEQVVSEDNAASENYMEDYSLKPEIVLYFQKQNQEDAAKKLAESYREICLRYVLYQALSADPETVTREALKKAMDACGRLGENWLREAELRWFELRKDPKNPGTLVPTLQDTLKAYDVMLSIRELDPASFEENLINYLTTLRDYYLALPEEARALVSNSEEFIEFLKQYGLWKEEEPDNPDGGFSDWNMPDYTPEERSELIKDKEREIAAQKLSIKEAALAVKELQETVDGKIVKSSVSGTVLSIGSEQGGSGSEYFARISSAEGLYAQGVLDEFGKEEVKPGDVIQGTSLDSGEEFTAVIKEISQYPNSGNEGDFILFGEQNQNTSYYTFYALIEDAGDLPEGMAQLRLSGSSTEDAISVEQYFVRTEKNGTKYVLKRGEDGRLCKQTVRTGITNGSYVEILDGLTLEDWIAFPYGKDAVEGAQTVETDTI